MKSKQTDISSVEGSVKDHQEQFTVDEASYGAAQEHFHAISAGLSSNQDGQAASLKDQLMHSKVELSTAKTEKTQANMKLVL